MKNKKIVIAGGTGFVGSRIAQVLAKCGHTVLVLSRQPDANKQNSCGGVEYSNYADFERLSDQFDLFINLVAKNNNSRFTFEQYKLVNVDFARYLANLASKKNIPVYLYFSTSHTIFGNEKGFYAETKSIGERIQEKVIKNKFVVIYPPLIYGESWSGSLSFLNSFPRILSTKIFTLIKIIKPSVNIDQIISICRDIDKNSNSKIFISDDLDQNRAYGVFKLCLNGVFCIAAITIIFVIFPALFCLIKADSPGPVLFKQSRLGKGKKPFNCYKFRTMYSSTKETATHEAKKGSITRVGGFLRKTKIDELPQCINIILGQMDLIGYRPNLKSQELLKRERDTLGVYDKKPGITGLSQVSGLDMSQPSELAQTDHIYHKYRCVKLDILILIKTLIPMLR